MITDLLILFIVSIFSSFLVKFIDFCFNEGNIFDRYYLFIYNKFEKENPKLFKVLGGCIYCFGTWVFMFIYLLFNLYYTLPIIFILFGMGVNYISIEILNKFFDNE
jgi:hypothetical protein